MFPQNSAVSGGYIFVPVGAIMWSNFTQNRNFGENGKIAHRDRRIHFANDVEICSDTTNHNTYNYKKFRTIGTILR